MARLSPVAEETTSETLTPVQVKRGRGRPKTQTGVVGRPRKSNSQTPLSSSRSPAPSPREPGVGSQPRERTTHTPLPSSPPVPPTPKNNGTNAREDDALFPEPGSGEEPSVHLIRMRIMQRMRAIDDKRYAWAPRIIERLSGRILEDWKSWKQERDQLEGEIDKGMRELGAAGFAKEVDELARFLVASPRVSQPGRWEIPFFVPGSKGRQMLIFRGPADGETRDDARAPTGPGVPGDVQSSAPAPALGDIPEDDIRRFLSLSDKAGLDLNNAAVSVPLTHARVEHYIFTTGPTAFCIHCPCPKVVIPTLALNPSTPTHELLPPFLDIDNSLDHFRNKHREDFSDVEQLLSKYGQISSSPTCMHTSSGHQLTSCSHRQEPEQMGCCRPQYIHADAAPACRVRVGSGSGPD